MRHPSIKVGWGGGVSYEKNFYDWPSHASHTHIPPAAETASNHPNYNLLRFSAALAPKFTPWQQDSTAGQQSNRAAAEQQGSRAARQQGSRQGSRAAKQQDSKAELDANWRFLGNPGVHHFTPARF